MYRVRQLGSFYVRNVMFAYEIVPADVSILYLLIFTSFFDYDGTLPV